MKKLAGKFWVLYVLGILLQVIVAAAVGLWYFADIYPRAESLLGLVYSAAISMGAANLFDFIVRWSAWISLAGMVIVLVPAALTLLERRRRGALVRVNIWAADAIESLNMDAGVATPMADKEAGLKRITQKILLI